MFILQRTSQGHSRARRLHFRVDRANSASGAWLPAKTPIPIRRWHRCATAARTRPMPLLQEGGDAPHRHMRHRPPPQHNLQGVGAVTDGIGAPRGLPTVFIAKLVDAIATQWEANAIRDVGVVDLLLAPIAIHPACRSHGDQAKKARVMLEFTSYNTWTTDEQQMRWVSG